MSVYILYVPTTADYLDEGPVAAAQNDGIHTLSV